MSGSVFKTMIHECEGLGFRIQKRSNLATPTIGFCIFGCVWYWLKKPTSFTIFLIFATIYESYSIISSRFQLYLLYFQQKKVSLMDTSCVCMFFFRIYLFQLNMKCSTQIENLIHYFIKIVGGQQIIKDLHMSQSGD